LIPLIQELHAGNVINTRTLTLCAYEFVTELGLTNDGKGGALFECVVVHCLDKGADLLARKMVEIAMVLKQFASFPNMWPLPAVCTPENLRDMMIAEEGRCVLGPLGS
jgi:hypothetical protein